MENHGKRPVYHVIIRALQALFGLMIIAIAAYFIHGASTSEVVWALICGLITIGIAAVHIISSKIPALQSKPITLILLGVDGLFIIFWLAAMCANARLISILNVPITCAANVDRGTVINNNICVTKRTNANLVVGPVGKGILGAIVAFSFLEMILFAAIAVLTFLHQRRAKSDAPMPLQKTEVDTFSQAAPTPQQNAVWEAQPSMGAYGQQAPVAYQQQAPAPYQQQVNGPYQQIQPQTNPAQYQQGGYQGPVPQETVSPVYGLGQGGNDVGYNAPPQHYPSPVGSPDQVQGNGQQPHYPAPRR